MTDDEQKKLREFLLLGQYLNDKSAEIEQFNQKLSNPARYNQRRLTNLGTFRAYVELESGSGRRTG
jgi:miniconductance mechanosensitive channel